MVVEVENIENVLEECAIMKQKMMHISYKDS